MPRFLHCSFCGKSDQEVAKLAAGPGGLHICNECVAICQVIMAGEQPGPSRHFDPRTWPTGRLLSLLPALNATVESHRQHLQGIVETLRSRDISWAKIAEPLGISRQSAWERFG